MTVTSRRPSCTAGCFTFACLAATFRVAVFRTAAYLMVAIAATASHVGTMLVFPIHPTSDAFAAESRLRVLLLTGKNNHDWRQTTPVLSRVFEESGRFTVRALEDPSVCNGSMLENYDVIVSNWTNFPSREREWGETAENAIMEFVRAGKGFVVVHAASATFPLWTDYQRLVGATWGNSTGHGAYHAFTVTVVDTMHPVTRVTGDFTMEDELWHRMAISPDAHVLLKAFSDSAGGGTGRWEPIAYSTAFGQGRSFYIVLGHDARAMTNPNWELLLLRGTEWAATGSTSIEILSNIPEMLRRAVSNANPDREELEVVGRLVQSSSRNPALRRELARVMAGMLAGSASMHWKKYFCEQISLIGGPDEVAALAQLLNNPELGFHSRYALERIPDGRSTKPFREAAAAHTGLMLIGEINALGERKDAEAIELLGRYAVGEYEDQVKGAAIHALGKIGSSDAARLVMAASAADTSLRLLRAESLLRCANACEVAEDLPGAAELYEPLLAMKEFSRLRVAAFAGLIRCRKDRGSALLTEALKSGDDVLHSAVVEVAKSPASRELTSTIAAGTSRLPDARRAQMFYALADAGERGILPDMHAAASHRNRILQAAALYGIGKLGDSSSVGRLCAVIGRADVRRKQDIRASLIRLSGPGVDERLLSVLESRAKPAVIEQVVSVLAARNCRGAVPALLNAAQSGGAGVRKASIDALGSLADGSVSPNLVRMLKNGRFEAERPALVRTLVKIGLRDGTPDRVCGSVLAELPGSSPPVKESMFQILGKFGGEKAYDAVRSGLSDPDADLRAAAIRVLSSWPDSAPVEDLFLLAHASGDAGRRTLALWGGVALLEKSSDLQQQDRVRLIEREFRSADSEEAKRLLISALGKQSSLKALQVAVSCLDQPGVEDEAVLAVAEIARATGNENPAESRKALERALESCGSHSLAQQVRNQLSELDFRSGEGTMKVAIVTGGHAFDEPVFLGMFTSDEGITFTHLPQTDESEVFDDARGWPYDVIVLYNFTQRISLKRRQNFLNLLDNGVGIVSLHHASGAFQEWCEYPEIIGVKYLLAPTERNGVRREASVYQHDVDIPVRVVDTAHAVTKGVRDFIIHDETYKGCEFQPDNRLLLMTVEPKSDQPLGWTRTFRRSRVVHFQLGHGPEAFAHEQFRRLVIQAIRWCGEGRREQIQREKQSRGGAR